MRFPLKSFMVLTFGLLVTACAGSGPEATAVAFTRSVISGNVDEVMTHLSSEVNVIGYDKVHGMFTMMVNQARRAGELSPNAKITVLETEVSEAGDMATVKLQVEDRDPTEVYLVREDQEWKVSISNYADDFEDK